MEPQQNVPNKTTISLIGVLILILFGSVGYTTYSFMIYKDKFEHSQHTLATTTAQLKETQKNLAQSQEEAAELSNRLQHKEDEVEKLDEELNKAEKNVDVLTKLQTIDPELLKKYSRVYFLNEHYRPDKLTQIDEEYWYPEGDDEFVHAQVWPHLEELLEDAKDDGIDLKIVSAFRTFDRQRELKSHYNITYGQGTANQFSAPQGYSEHQLGTTIDFTSKELDDAFAQFEQTTAYEWLDDNAHKYGFVLSYPEGNQYYQFEPWHWRFVGRELAEDLQERDMHFYEMDQEKIDMYRLDLFEE